MTLNSREFIRFEGLLAAIIIVAGIVIALLGGPDIGGAWLFFLLPPHVLGGALTWLVCREPHWAGLALWQTLFSSVFIVLMFLAFSRAAEGSALVFLIVIGAFMLVLSVIISIASCFVYGRFFSKNIVTESDGE